MKARICIRYLTFFFISDVQMRCTPSTRATSVRRRLVPLVTTGVTLHSHAFPVLLALRRVQERTLAAATAGIQRWVMARVCSVCILRVRPARTTVCHSPRVCHVLRALTRSQEHTLVNATVVDTLRYLAAVIVCGVDILHLTPVRTP